MVLQLFDSKGFWTFCLWIILFAGVILCVHAVIQHGQDAQIVRQCANDPNNLLSQWHDLNTGCTHNLVSLPGHDRAVGDQITVTGSDGAEHEVTSLIPRGGNLSKIIDWLVGKGCIQCATK